MCVWALVCMSGVTNMSLWVCVSAHVCAPTYVSLGELAVPVCPCAGGCAHVCVLRGVCVCACGRGRSREFPCKALGQQSGKLLLLFSFHRTNSFPSSWAQIHLSQSFIHPIKYSLSLQGPCQPPPYCPTLGPWFFSKS